MQNKDIVKVHICMETSAKMQLKQNKNIYTNSGDPFDKFLKFSMGVSKNSGTPKSSILIGFSIINHPFSGTPIFGNTHIGWNSISSQTNPMQNLQFFSRKDGRMRRVAENLEAEPPNLGLGIVFLGRNPMDFLLVFQGFGSWCIKFPILLQIQIMIYIYLYIEMTSRNISGCWYHPCLYYKFWISYMELPTKNNISPERRH